MKITQLTAWMLLAFWGSTTVNAAPYVILKKDNRRIDAQSITGSPSGDVTVLDTAGSRFTYKRDEIATLYVDPPAEWGVARQKASAGQLDESLADLNLIVQRYPGLGYDTQAGDLAIQILLRQKKNDEAVRLAERVIRSNASALSSNAAFQSAYWKALLATGKTAQLNDMIHKAIKEGAREEAARAQLMRGDMRFAENKYKEAVLDYLRTVVFYEAQRDVQPEALMKTAQTFELLKDSARAKSFYEKLKTDYPDTPQGQQAKSKT